MDCDGADATEQWLQTNTALICMLAREAEVNYGKVGTESQIPTSWDFELS